MAARRIRRQLADGTEGSSWRRFLLVEILRARGGGGRGHRLGRSSWHRGQVARQSGVAKSTPYRCHRLHLIVNPTKCGRLSKGSEKAETIDYFMFRLGLSVLSLE